MNCGGHIKGNRDPVIMLHSDVCKHVGPNAGMATYAEDSAAGAERCFWVFGQGKGMERKGQDIRNLGVLKASPSFFGIQTGRQWLNLDVPCKSVSTCMADKHGEDILFPACGVPHDFKVQLHPGMGLGPWHWAPGSTERHFKTKGIVT